MWKPNVETKQKESKFWCFQRLIMASPEELTSGKSAPLGCWYHEQLHGLAPGNARKKRGSKLLPHATTDVHEMCFLIFVDRV